MKFADFFFSRFFKKFKYFRKWIFWISQIIDEKFEQGDFGQKEKKIKMDLMLKWVVPFESVLTDFTDSNADLMSDDLASTSWFNRQIINDHTVSLRSFIPIHEILFEPIERVKSKVHDPNEFKWAMLYYTGRS